MAARKHLERKILRVLGRAKFTGAINRLLQQAHSTVGMTDQQVLRLAQQTRATLPDKSKDAQDLEFLIDAAREEMFYPTPAGQIAEMVDPALIS